MSAYQSACSTVSGLSYTPGTYPICEESFQQAISAAGSYLSSTGTSAFIIDIDAGTYDYSAETSPLSGLNGAIDVSNIAPTNEPAGEGCLINYAPFTNGQAASGNGCLIIQGNNSSNTTLVTSTATAEIYGREANHVMFRFITFLKQNVSATQGTFVSSGTTIVSNGSNTDTFATLTMSVPSGLPTPGDLFTQNCNINALNGCNASGPQYASDQIVMKGFTGGAAPTTVLSTCSTQNQGCDNAGRQWGFPQTRTGEQILPAPPVNSPAGSNVWTLTLSKPTAQAVVPSAYSGTTGGLNNLICMRVDNAGTFFFIGGTDIIFNRVAWVGGTRGVFRGTNGSATGVPYGARYTSRNCSLIAAAGPHPAFRRLGASRLVNRTTLRYRGT
jgi:hypothetical protein